MNKTGGKIPLPSKEELSDLYLRQRMTGQQLAERYHVGEMTMWRWLKAYGIDRSDTIPSRDDLIELYEEQRLTSEQIGQRFGVSKDTALSWLKKRGIKRRKAPIPMPAKDVLIELYERQGLHSGQIAEQFQVRQQTVLQWMSRYGIKGRWRWEQVPTREELADLYVGQGLSAEQIAAQFGISAGPVLRWLKRYGIELRPRALPVPSRNELLELYENQRLTMDEIGRQFGASDKGCVQKWFREYGIIARPIGRGLDNRGIQAPTRDELYQLVHVEYQSYEAIAALYGVDKTAISHWLDKHGIERPYSGGWYAKLGYKPALPDADTLRTLYLDQFMSLDDIGARYGVSSGPISRLCDDFGIPIRPNNWGGERIPCADGHLVRSRFEQRVDDWLHTHHVLHEYEPSFPYDNRFIPDFLANGWYIEVWGVTNSATYEERRYRKIELYHLHKLPLIEIPACAFKSHHWERLLHGCLNPPPIASEEVETYEQLTLHF